ncbi:MAG: hypothetical protein ACR2PW_01425 [Gammaproteobacteria bacterium]
MTVPPHEFQQIFSTLRHTLCQYANALICVHNTASNYYLDTPFVMKNGKPLFFGAVHIRKNYVSYHLMPVYVFPQLTDELSEELRRHMHGKSCFNFKVSKPPLFSELAHLTQAGFNQYQRAGYLPAP